LEQPSRPIEEFIENRLDGYAEHRNQPLTNRVSHMSKYLHSGHISPVYLALRIRDPGACREDVVAQGTRLAERLVGRVKRFGVS
jgi:deoxyribodipyrimidine photolyase